MQHYRKENIPSQPAVPKTPASDQVNELGLKGPLSPLAEDAIGFLKPTGFFQETNRTLSGADT